MKNIGKQNRNEWFLGAEYIYTGGAEWIKVSNGIQQWDKLYAGELIEGKKYKIGAPCFWAPGRTLLKENSQLNIEDSWEYYSYFTVKNEYDQEIYVESIFFKEIE